ncbi:MAG: diversity-generating retroelement protein Avd [Gammaproteobacteria bacterium]|nr:diversity-generating retroelement protein Avd [Gammaproteobacteria bacterium]MBT7306609.1 diversity-generating retroelement protein Avd [Gammaproteobacteria bacterium]
MVNPCWINCWQRVVMQKSNQDLPVFVKWIDFLEWLLPVTERFPKRVRFSFSERINQLALDIVEDLVEARYSNNKREILRRANLRLEKLRVLLRISNKQKFLDYKRYEYAMQEINQVGKMLGGWLKQQQ